MARTQCDESRPTMPHGVHRTCLKHLAHIQLREINQGTPENKKVFAFIEAAGWPGWPLVLASVVSLAIIGERAWSLRPSVVAPPQLLSQVVQEYRQNGVDPMTLARLSSGSPLAQIFAAGLKNV